MSSSTLGLPSSRCPESNRTAWISASWNDGHSPNRSSRGSRLMTLITCPHDGGHIRLLLRDGCKAAGDRGMKLSVELRPGPVVGSADPGQGLDWENADG